MKLNRQKIILIIFITLLIIGGLVWFFAINQTTSEDGEGGTRNLFPFGEIFQGSGRGDGNTQGTIGEENTPGEQITDGDPEEVAGPQLRLINDEPTGGMIPLIRTEEKDVASTEFDEEGNAIQKLETIEVENQFVRYSNILDGSVYETRLTGENPFTEELIVENYVPNAEHVVFSNNGAHAAFQYWNNESRTIETYLGMIEPLTPDVQACPFTFTGGITVGEEGVPIYELHQFLNRDARTQIASTGVNSPGNEGTLATEATIEAVKKFQTLYDLEADGALGPQTRGEMERICNEQQERMAEAELEERDTKYDLTGFFLPQDIISIVMSPDSTKAFSLEKDASSVAGTVRTFADQSRSTIFTSPYTDWTSTWQNDEYIEIQTKPSYASFGYSYELKAQDGDFHKSLKERQGLMTLPNHSNTKLLVYDVENDRPTLSVFDRETQILSPLNLESFTDKCVWSTDDTYIYCAVPNSFAYGKQYPDTWYQGLELYTDSLWSINASTLQTEVVSDISGEYGENIDVEKITIDRNNQYLYFIDKDTEYLWSYRLDEI